MTLHSFERERISAYLSDIQFEIVDMIPSDYVKMNRTTAISDRVRLDLSKVLTEK